MCTDPGIKTCPRDDSLLSNQYGRGTRAFFWDGSPKSPVAIQDSVILPTCHMRALDLDGPACLEFELQ